ncbi:MAG: hypothetical protein ACP5I8_13610 [Phycisphaerae bacterium]
MDNVDDRDGGEQLMRGSSPARGSRLPAQGRSVQPMVPEVVASATRRQFVDAMARVAVTVGSGYTNMCTAGNTCFLGDPGCRFSGCCRNLDQCSSEFSCGSGNSPPA